MRRFMFPQLKLTPTRAAFARPGPVATPFPDVSAPMQPSDSSLPSAAAPVFPRQRPTSVRRACSSPPHRCPRKPVQRRRLFYPGSPSAGSLPKEKRGYPRCLGHPLRACRGLRPRRVQPPLARSRCGYRPSSGELKPWTPGKLPISWLHNPRPTRSRTYASPNPLPSPAQGSLPARAGSPLAGRVSHPLDDKQGFMKSSHTPLLLDQPCLVALILGTNLPMTPMMHRRSPVGRDR